MERAPPPELIAPPPLSRGRALLLAIGWLLAQVASIAWAMALLF